MESRKIPIKYDINLLTKFCKENEIVLEGIYDKLTRESIITGKCIESNCNETFNKNFRQLLISNGYCKTHTLLNSKQKSKQTFIEKYGALHPLKSEEIKQKIINTNLEKYGVSNTFQYKVFKEKSKETCKEKYGVNNPMQCNDIKEKVKQTMQDRYGVKYPSQNEEFKQKSKDTCMKNHGVEYSLQSQDIRNKSIETCIEKYGVKNPMQCVDIKQKVKQTCLEKYNVENPFQNEEIKQKIKTIFLQKYGVNHPMQHTYIMDKNIKSSFRTKSYTLPSGTVLQYQGYENYAIDELLQSGIEEQDIINGCENIPDIWYESTNGKIRKHFVDLYIPSQNKCIEVKSTWTFSDAKDSEEIFHKQKAAKELGYNYEIWVYNGKGVKINCII